jgi:fibronectin type 3 domain-containing protein
MNGAAAGTTTADGAGNYVFTGLGDGNYTVTPTSTGFAFAPTNQSVTVSGANVSGVNFTASPQVAHSVALTWIASTTATVTGYNVYRSLVSGTSYIKINSSIVLAPLVGYTDTTPSSGTTCYYVTTAVDANGSESAFSNEVSAVIP